MFALALSGADFILKIEGSPVIAPLRFLWNATRGHRLAPWRSDYLRWRMETYTGERAETLTVKRMFRLAWSMRGELVRFLIWTDRLKREVRKRA